MRPKCDKCDERGMIKDGEYSRRSCECGFHNDLMEAHFKGWTLVELVAFKERRLREKGKV